MMVQNMQRMLCDPDTSEEDAKEMQRQLKELMSEEEIKELSLAPVSGTVKDLTPLRRQLVVALAQEKKGNPLYNQRQLEVEDLTARMDRDFAERVLLPGEDPSEQAEQSRQQDLETMLLSSGHPVPVSPRDNHLVHLQELMPDAEQAAQHMGQGQMDTSVLEAMLAHISEHYNQALAQGVKKENLAEVKSLVDKAGEALSKLKEMDQQEQLLHQQEQQGGPPPPPPQ
jgi:hypothetical protein